MRTNLATLLFIVAFFTSNSAPVLAGKLGSVRDNVREEQPKEASSKKKEKKKRSSSSRDRDKSDFSWLSFSLSLFEGSSSKPRTRQVAHQDPYLVDLNAPGAQIPPGYEVQPNPGHLSSNQPYLEQPVYPSAPTVTTAPQRPPSHRHRKEGWGHRFTILGGTDFDTLDHGHIAWLGQIPNSLGLDTSLTTFRESSATIRDQLWLGDANLVFEPIFGDLRARIGLGFNWLHDSIGTEFGGNLTAGFDLEIWDALILTGEVDTGTLGDSDFFHGQVSVGYQIGATELFAGYNYYNIGGADLDGTIFGLRFRF